MFWRPQQNFFFGSLPDFPVCLSAHLFPSLQLSFFRRKDTQVDANDHEHALKKKAKHVGWCSFPEGLVLVGVPLSKKFRRGKLDGREPIPFSFGFSLLHWVVFHATLISSRALTVCCLVYTISTVSFSFALKLALGCSSARGGLRLAVYLFEQYLERTETARDSAVLTV